MKEFIIIILTVYCCYYVNCICIQGNNCPNGQGFCKAGSCVCEKNFWTLPDKDQLNPIYCNYQRHNHFYLLLFEFFIPTSGHFIAGKYYFAIFKLILLFIPLLSCVFGYISFYNEEGRAKKQDITNDQIDNNSEGDNNLHMANKEEKNLSLSVYLPVVITFISLSLFVLMHIVDIICYLIPFYNDGNGVPLA